MRRIGPAIGVSAVLLALVVSGQAQERRAEPVAAQSDKVDFALILDSWYKLVEPAKDGGEDKAVGFVHEVVTRMQQGSPWRYTYDMTGEVDILVPVEGKPESKMPEIHATHLRAHLDDTFAPVYMDRQDLKGANSLATKIFAADNVRRIEVGPSGQDQKKFIVNPDEEIFYSRFLMFIALRQSGALSRPGTRKAVLMHPREDGTPPYAEVTIEIKEMVKRTVMGKKDVSVTPITYLKPPPASTPEDELLTAFIDKYGRIVEEESRNKARRFLVLSEKEALGDRPLIISARRDPFHKDSAFGAGRDKEIKASDKPRIEVETPDGINKSIEELTKQVGELQKAKTEDRVAEGEKIYARLLDLVDALLLKHIKEPLKPDQYALVIQSQEQMEKIWGGVERLMKRARLVFVRSTQMFDRDDCVGMEAGIKEIKAMTAAKEIKNQPNQLAELHKWVGQLEPLVLRCKTRLDLAKKKLELTGTTLSEVWEQVPVDLRTSVFGHQLGAVLDVRFVRPVRIAILNGKPYRVGDVVDGENVRIEKIWAHGVQVSLRDETRDVGIRQ